MDRREFLRRAALLPAALAPFSCGTGSRVSRPNIVLVLSDDQRLDTLSQGAMPKTLARFSGGLTFSNGFVTTPLCGPSRVSIMTGKRVPNHGIGKNEGCAKRFWTNYARDSLGWWLNQEAGYRAGYYGKVLNGFERIPARRLPGYEDFVGSLGNRDPIVWQRNGTVRRTSNRRKNETKALADLALAFIARARKTPDVPYFAFCAVKSPHVPLDPSDKNRNAYAGVPYPAGPAFDHRDEGKPSFVRNENPLSGGEKDRIGQEWRRRNEEILDLDDQIDRIFDAVDLEDTYVIFTSDNAVLEGEHRLRSKAHPYDPATRVPFMIAGPGMREPGTTPLMAANTDIAPTILELAGLDPEGHGCDGMSLVPPMFDATVPQEDWRVALAMDCRSPGKAAEDWGAVRTPDSLFVERGNGEREYYDLEDDPHQLHSLQDERPAEAATMSEKLESMRAASGEDLRAKETT